MTEKVEKWREQEREIDGGYTGNEYPRLWPPRPELHRCTDACVCPIHETRMFWSAQHREHACPDLECPYAYGLERTYPHDLPLRS